MRRTSLDATIDIQKKQKKHPFAHSAGTLRNNHGTIFKIVTKFFGITNLLTLIRKSKFQLNIITLLIFNVDKLLFFYSKIMR